MIDTTRVARAPGNLTFSFTPPRRRYRNLRAGRSRRSAATHSFGTYKSACSSLSSAALRSETAQYVISAADQVRVL
jgi:hypothetical protein